MNETKKSRAPMKVPSKQDLKARVALLEQENTALNATVENLWAWKTSLHQSVMDMLQTNRYAFTSATTLAQVAHDIGKIIRGEAE